MNPKERASLIDSLEPEYQPIGIGQTVPVTLKNGSSAYARWDWLRSTAIVSLIRTSRLPAPTTCYCGQPPIAVQLMRESHRGQRYWFPWQSRASLTVPLCEEHSQRERPELEFTLDRWYGGWVAYCYVVASSLSLVEFALQRGTSGDQLPPWIVFPGRDPYVGWNQGIEGGWRDDAWFPFWRGLQPAERSAYLVRWAAPDEWIEALTVAMTPFNLDRPIQGEWLQKAEPEPPDFQ